jgi:hypothetical protein
MPTYNRLTDRTLATGVTLNDLIHIVITGDTSQNPAGSSYKATISQLASIITGATGSSGSAGTAGTSGTNGSSGINGTSGSSGINGTNGSNGTSGTSGGVGSGQFLPLSGGTVTGNTYFGITSGITIDQVNKRIGINTSNPSSTIEAFGTNSKINYENTSGGVFQLSGDTFLPRFSVAGAPSLTKPLFGLSMGLRTYNDVTFPGYGKVGDGHLYASNEMNGLNIINRQSLSALTEDYIRFYAGQDANGTIPDIHIQGTGTTRGYVGIGTINPTELLDVNGKIKTINFQMTSGATAGYILVSDASGNGIWSAATVSGGSSGTSGSSGINGSSGSSGLNGSSGIDGTSGSSGLSGTNGISGSSGVSGSSGLSGSSGSSGSSGVNGTSGTSGVGSGNFLPLSGGTVTGTTLFTQGISATTFSAITVGSSANCISDLYVSSIHSCSPLLINPLNEGQVIFGQSNQMVLDLSNKYVGFNKVPTFPFDFTTTFGTFGFKPSVVNSNMQISGTSNQFTSILFVAGTSSLSVGSYGLDYSSGGFATGDTFVQASANNNSLQIITLTGDTGNKDIKLKAGRTASDNSDLFIKGTGTTRGYVGFGTENPTERVDVSGKTKTINLQITSGASAGYVLVSDASGNAIWSAATMGSGSSGTSGSSGSSGTNGTNGTSGTSPVSPYPYVFGLFSQTGNSVTVSGTTSETTIVGSGIGTLIVPANGFSIGDSFTLKMFGDLGAQNNDTLQIKVKSGSVILGDTGLVTMPTITDNHFMLDIGFTIRATGSTGNASILSSGFFTFITDSSNNYAAQGFTTVNNTTFDTTSSNTLDITVQFSTTNAANFIYSEFLVLNKVY